MWLFVGLMLLHGQISERRFSVEDVANGVRRPLRCKSADDRLSPGMVRARARHGQSSRFIDITPTRVETTVSSSFARGERVFHQKFGYGTVQSIEGERLTIDFDKAGEKKVIASFVVPEANAG